MDELDSDVRVAWAALVTSARRVRGTPDLKIGRRGTLPSPAGVG